jgi:acetyltransferase-like isoleucine patch superfamily enzyme
VAAALREVLKQAIRAASLIVTFPLAALAGFGRIHAGFQIGVQICAQIPGLPGDYLRVAFCRWTLELCAPDCRISFGTLFSQPEAEIGRRVYIGAYCLIGRARIGAGSQIASHVQILSGRHQHVRDAQSGLTGAEEGVFEQVVIGESCWIGAGAIVMANIGPGTTVGAGAVVTRELPAGVVAVGNPAKVIRGAAGIGSSYGSG